MTNPAPGFLASLKHAMHELGVPCPADRELKQFIGPPLRNTFASLLATDDLDLVESAVEHYRWRLDNGGKFEAKVIDGIPQVLEYFSDHGYDLYVCTGKPECVATEIVEHFDLRKYFKHVYGAQLSGLHCEKADLIEYIWEQESIPPSKGIMVGDTVFDIEAAKANHLVAIAVSWGFGEDQDLADAGADKFVSTAADLIPVIESFVR